MISAKKNKGFTVIELLIVIVIIGILATLVVITYNSIKQKDRDTQRKTNINTLQGKVEAYFAQNGKYPTLANINNSSWRTANMKTLNVSTLQDPKSKTPTLVAAPATNAYAYEPTPIDCNNNGLDCTGYTLTATLEAGGTYVKQTLD